MLSRRSMLVGLLATPAIVHAGNLMPVRSIERFLEKRLHLTGGWLNWPGTMLIPMELGDTIEVGSKGLFRITSYCFWDEWFNVSLTAVKDPGNGVMLFLPEQSPVIRWE